MSIGDGDNDDHQNDPPGFSHKNPFDIYSKIMATFIAFLSLVVTLILIMNICARCVIRRRDRSRSVIPIDDSVNDHHSIEPPKTGIDPTVIAALPLFSFNQTGGGHGEEEDVIIECAVCLSILENEEMARVLPNCEHTFHAECIDKWLGSHSTCPICRTEVEPRLKLEPREGPRPASVALAAAATTNPTLVCAEGTSNNSNGVEASAKFTESSSSRLRSYRRIMLSRDRSSRRLQFQDQVVDLERQ